MATKRKASEKQLISNPLVRILGQHAPAQQVLQQVAERGDLPITMRNGSAPTTIDYSLIDPVLALEPPTAGQPTGGAPPAGAGYAAFTPGQRYMLLQWLNAPTAPAPPAFQQFYLAQLEVSLLEPNRRAQVIAELQQLQAAPSWQHHIGLARLRLLAYWLTQDGSGLAAWLGAEGGPGSLLGVALGLQALLNVALQPAQLPPLFQQWSVDAVLPSQALLTLRLSSLAAALGREPLAYALAQLGEAAQQPQPWRCQHREIRIALPQPDLRPVVEPLLRDLATMTVETANLQDDMVDADNEDDASTPGWQLVLEFGESRSDFFALALRAAQKQPGYLALMDENRRLLHRVHFQKGEVRRFWRLWDYVQSWSTTKVYINGDEISKWELYGRLWQVR